MYSCIHCEKFLNVTFCCFKRMILYCYNSTLNFSLRVFYVLLQDVLKENSHTCLLLGLRFNSGMYIQIQFWSQAFDLWIYNFNASVVVGYSVFQGRRKYFSFQNALGYSRRRSWNLPTRYWCVGYWNVSCQQKRVKIIKFCFSNSTL
jgi:hypothetical protein